MPSLHRVRNYPPGRTGVLLPMEGRRAAALGVCMYTTCNPLPYLVHRTAYTAVSLFGARAIPSRSQSWDPVSDPDAWEMLRRELVGAVGDFDHIAAYRRHQAERSGLTMTMIRGDHPVAVVKLRSEPTGLSKEQEALSAVAAFRPSLFRAPEPLGSGSVDCPSTETWHWSAQSAVFTRPHRPFMNAPRDLFDQISESLVPTLPPHSGLQPGHGDVAPWNLRLDHRGQCWLFDWEDCALAPPDADRAYYAACLHVLRGEPLPSDLGRNAILHWRRALELRRDTTVADQPLTRQLLRALGLP